MNFTKYIHHMTMSDNLFSRLVYLPIAAVMLLGAVVGSRFSPTNFSWKFAEKSAKKQNKQKQKEKERWEWKMCQETSLAASRCKSVNRKGFVQLLSCTARTVSSVPHSTMRIPVIMSSRPWDRKPVATCSPLSPQWAVVPRLSTATDHSQ